MPSGIWCSSVVSEDLMNRMTRRLPPPPPSPAAQGRVLNHREHGENIYIIELAATVGSVTVPIGTEQLLQVRYEFRFSTRPHPRASDVEPLDRCSRGTGADACAHR